jgi:hypothetical protein
MRKNMTGVQTETPWTKAAAFVESGRPQGVSFQSAVYPHLLAEFIVESSSAFSMVEYTSFHKLVRYLLIEVPLIGRCTVQRATI